MTAGRYNLTIERGATLDQVFTWKDSTLTAVNLTGYTARCQVKRTIGDVSPLLNLTTENGGITLGGVAGTITLYASDTATGALTGEEGVWDLELISGGGIVKRILQGKVFISPNVTT